MRFDESRYVERGSLQGRNELHESRGLFLEKIEEDHYRFESIVLKYVVHKLYVIVKKLLIHMEREVERERLFRLMRAQPLYTVRKPRLRWRRGGGSEGERKRRAGRPKGRGRVRIGCLGGTETTGKFKISAG